MSCFCFLSKEEDSTEEQEDKAVQSTVEDAASFAVGGRGGGVDWDWDWDPPGQGPKGTEGDREEELGDWARATDGGADCGWDCDKTNDCDNRRWEGLGEGGGKPPLMVPPCFTNPADEFGLSCQNIQKARFALKLYSKLEWNHLVEMPVVSQYHIAL